MLENVFLDEERRLVNSVDLPTPFELSEPEITSKTVKQLGRGKKRLVVEDDGETRVYGLMQPTYHEPYMDADTTPNMLEQKTLKTISDFLLPKSRFLTEVYRIDSPSMRDNCSIDDVLKKDSWEKVEEGLSQLSTPALRYMQIYLEFLGDSKKWDTSTLAPQIKSLHQPTVQRIGAVVNLTFEKRFGHRPPTSQTPLNEGGLERNITDLFAFSRTKRLNASTNLLSHYMDNAAKPSVDDRVPDILQRMEKDGEPLVRSNLAAVIGIIKPYIAIEPLTKLLQKEKDASVRENIVYALGQIPDARTIPPLVTALGDGSTHVRTRAYAVLSDKKDDQSIKMLSEKGLEHNSADVRKASAEILASSIAETDFTDTVREIQNRLIVGYRAETDFYAKDAMFKALTSIECKPN